ncbi:MAG: hypothetical protein AN484_26700, partial [Aphanizomenon flos-aquae WA102]
LRRIDKSRLEVDVLGGQTESYGKYLLVLEDCAGVKHEILVRAVAQIGKAYSAKCPAWIGEILPGLEGQEAELTQRPGNVDVMLGLDQVRYFPVESGRYRRLTYQVSGFKGSNMLVGVLPERPGTEAGYDLSSKLAASRLKRAEEEAAEEAWARIRQRLGDDDIAKWRLKNEPEAKSCLPEVRECREGIPEDEPEEESLQDEVYEERKVIFEDESEAESLPPEVSERRTVVFEDEPEAVGPQPENRERQEVSLEEEANEDLRANPLWTSEDEEEREAEVSSPPRKVCVVEADPQPPKETRTVRFVEPRRRFSLSPWILYLSCMFMVMCRQTDC